MPTVPTNIGSPNLSEVVNNQITMPNNYKLNTIIPQEEQVYSSLQIGAGKTAKKSKLKSKSKSKSKTIKKPVKKTKSSKKPAKNPKSKTTKNPVKKIDTFTKEKLVRLAKKYGIKVSSKGVSRTKEQIFKSLLRKKLI
jgi:hypothetical protein